MTRQEFSDSFTTLLNSYGNPADFGEQSSSRNIILDEYEKSVFLTLAQEDIVKALYNGKNTSGDSFESSEELRRQLDSLVKTEDYVPQSSITGIKGVSDDSVFVQLPADLAYITMEQVIFNDSQLCNNGVRVNVQPTKQDEYNKVKDNPFRKATRYKALRLDAGMGVVELVSDYRISKYILRYVSKPEPIILEDLPDGLSIEGRSQANECKLDSTIHKMILDRAVLMALQAKGINTDK